MATQVGALVGELRVGRLALLFEQHAGLNAAAASRGGGATVGQLRSNPLAVIFEQHAQVAGGGCVAEPVGALVGLPSSGQLPVIFEQQSELERVLGVAALVRPTTQRLETAQVLIFRSCWDSRRAGTRRSARTTRSRRTIPPGGTMPAGRPMPPISRCEANSTRACDPRGLPTSTDRADPSSAHDKSSSLLANPRQNGILRRRRDPRRPLAMRLDWARAARLISSRPVGQTRTCGNGRPKDRVAAANRGKLVLGSLGRVR